MESPEKPEKYQVEQQNRLVLKIALLLKYITKDQADEAWRIADKTKADTDLLKRLLKSGMIDSGESKNISRIRKVFNQMQEDPRFGTLCLDFRFLNSSTLDLALKEQNILSGKGAKIKIGDLLVQACMISRGQRDLVLEKQKTQKTVRQNSEPSGTAQIDGTYEKSVGETESLKEIKTHEFSIYITADALGAYLKKTRDFDPIMSVEELKAELAEYGVVHGLVSDEKLAAFIDSAEYTETLFEAASASPPSNGRDASVELFFPTEYRRAGKVKKDGTIDYKERGRIPLVKTDELLARKTPAVEGEAGLNVFDEIVNAKPVLDVPLTAGSGTRISGDRLNVYADVGGYASVGQEGEIRVQEVCRIEGDVDYRTGHVKFEKSVMIEGTVRSGFRVEAENVFADAVDGGIIQAGGDVIVENGIIDSRIESRGNVSALFVQRSAIYCAGNMNVEKEIADSTVTIAGTFRMKYGKMLACSLSATSGAVVRDVGSKKAKRSVISVGNSQYLDNRMETIDRRMKRIQKDLEEAYSQRDLIERNALRTAEERAKRTESMERTRNMLEIYRTGENERNEDAIAMLEKTIGETESRIAELDAKISELSGRLQSYKDEAAGYSADLSLAVKEKLHLKKIAQNRPSNAVLEVPGRIVTGEVVAGCHSKVIIPERRRAVRIMEVEENDGNNKPHRRMVIGPLD